MSASRLTLADRGTPSSERLRDTFAKRRRSVQMGDSPVETAPIPDLYYCAARSQFENDRTSSGVASKWSAWNFALVGVCVGTAARAVAVPVDAVVRRAAA